MEGEPLTQDEIAEHRDVYRFASNPDLVIALGGLGLEQLEGIRGALGGQQEAVQTDISHLDAAIERHVI